MKANCMVISASEMLKIMEPYSAGKYRRNFKNPHFDKSGNFTYYEKVVEGWQVRERTPNECAEGICMPLWEVVTVDNGGFDEYALMFYEDNTDRAERTGRPNLVELYMEYITTHNVFAPECGLSAAFLHWLEDRVSLV